MENVFLNLKNLGLLLGFTKNQVTQKNTSVKSDSMADINHGLHYISICCDAVDRTKELYDYFTTNNHKSNSERNGFTY